MNITDHQAQYYSLQLTRRRASDDSEKLSSVLIDAKVDLNPHQVDAALFAFRSPLSRGAILADEVGLGKTIEAGILLSQCWASGQKKLIVIGPSNLRKQWSQELQEKFYLPSEILENKNFKEKLKKGKFNPFESNKIIICSFHFAKAQAQLLSSVDWDLVVIDEAHRLRNVYKQSNVIGRAIRDAVYPFKKVLLTATPLQNSLMELYGLVSIVDEHVFGSEESFRSRFTRSDDGADFVELKERFRPVIQRTLRRQVKGIPYTNRIPITIQFEPTEAEQALYEQVSTYLQRELIHAIPNRQRHLLTMIMRKILASSSFAIAATLNSLITRLERTLKDRAPLDIDDAFNDYEDIESLLDELEDDDLPADERLTQEEAELIGKELQELIAFRDLAMSIEHNAKGDNLTEALKQGFTKLKELGAAQKTIIFTESRRTQEYLFRQLEAQGYKGKVLLFNGSNDDERSKLIYKSWMQRHEGSDMITGSKTADMRQALVDHFRDSAEIMIATEAAAEGINLQFCSMIVNYDLPWNPQRIEQRIGRCHRYGQKFDVVVVNFINVGNAADRRVFQLLDEKFHLFSGVFGASDEVLGSIESGIDIERRIADIYQQCRNAQQIEQAFNALSLEIKDELDERMKKTQQKLLEHFDAEVLEKLKTRLEESQAYLTKFEKWLWMVTQKYLAPFATINSSKLEFTLKNNPFAFNVRTGRYTLDKKNTEALLYRINHPLANGILKHYSKLHLPVSQLDFNLSAHKGNISALDSLKKQSGWLNLRMVEVNSFELTDHILFTAITDKGDNLSQEQCSRMFDLLCNTTDEVTATPPPAFATTKDDLLQGLRLQLRNRDSGHLQQEVNKLNRWAEDRIYLSEKELKDTKQRIKTLTRQAEQATEPQEQLDIQKKIRELEKRQRKQRQGIFDAEDHVKDQRDRMITEIEHRMLRTFSEKDIFTVRWSII